MRKEQLVEEIDRINSLLAAANETERALLETKLKQLKEQLLQFNNKQVLKG